MDDIKHGYRDVETDTKKVLRDVDGESAWDRVGNAGDEIRRDLGNAGDAASDAASKASREAERGRDMRRDDTESADV